MPGLTGTAWKEKVVSIESISQGGLSGESVARKLPMIHQLGSFVVRVCGTLVTHDSVLSRSRCFRVRTREGRRYFPLAHRLRSFVHSSLTSSRADPQQYLGPVVLVVAAHTKQFKDSNFNVLKVAFNGIRVLLETGAVVDASRANRAAVAIVISPAVEKLGDRKLQVTTVGPLVSFQKFDGARLIRPLVQLEHYVDYVDTNATCF